MPAILVRKKSLRKRLI